ncbi:hypothetical protein EON65_45075 [archaeon]|nr:MAG: hypothetical protein EON65_45075 [archaeon]
MHDERDYPSDEEIVYGDGAPLYAEIIRDERRVDIDWKSNFDSLKGIKSLKEKVFIPIRGTYYIIWYAHGIFFLSMQAVGRLVMEGV